MKLPVKGLLMIVLLLAKTTTAQNLKVAKSGVLTYKSLKYVGSNSMYNFFYTKKEEKYYLIKVDADDINEIEEERIQLNEKEFADIFISDSNLFYITFTGTPAMYNRTETGIERIESTLTAVNFYKYNSYTGDLIAKKKINFEEEDIKANFGVPVYVNHEEHYIKVASVNYYNFNFEPIKDINIYEKTFNKTNHVFEVADKDYYGGAKPYFKDYKKEAVSAPKLLIKKSYNIEYTENTDNSVAVFKVNLTNVKILCNNGKEIKKKFQLPDTKTLIDLYATTTPDNSLILLGKYCEKKDDKIIYGFFTTKYNANLSVTKDIVYTPVIETDKKQKNLDKQAFANLFFVTSYFGFNYELTGNHSQFFFYQFCDTKIRGIVNYEVVAEDIYGILIDSSGIVKMSKYPLSQNSRLLGYCRPVIVGHEKDFYLIYYDNKNNMEPAGNKQAVECNLNVDNTVLVSHKIDVEKTDIEVKKVIFNCKDFHFIPETTMMKATTDGVFKDKIVYLSYSNSVLYQFTFE